MPPTNREQAVARVREWLDRCANPPNYVPDACPISTNPTLHGDKNPTLADIRALVEQPVSPTDAELEKIAIQAIGQCRIGGGSTSEQIILAALKSVRDASTGSDSSNVGRLTKPLPSCTLGSVR